MGPARGGFGRVVRRRRTQHHARRVSRPRHRVWCRADRYLPDFGVSDRQLCDAAHPDDLDPADHDRHHARFLVAEPACRGTDRGLCEPGVLYRDGDDRDDRAVGHRGAQRHSADRIPACRPGPGANVARCAVRGRRRADASDPFDGGSICAGRDPDHARSGVLGPRLGPDLRAVRFHGLYLAGGADDLFLGV